MIANTWTDESGSGSLVIYTQQPIYTQQQKDNICYPEPQGDSTEEQSE